MSLPRFHVPGVGPGAVVALPEHVAHHAREVLRLRAGAPVRVFDGLGSEWEAILDAVTRREVVARLGHAVPSRPESPLRLTLAMSPLRGDRMELVIQKATELGVTRIQAVVTARTDAAARPALHGTRHERWEKVASGAAEQCGRSFVPEIAPTITLAQLLGEPCAGRKLLFYEATDERLAASPAPTDVLALVGPPGGFETHEVARLTASGFEPASLGPRILRAETAAIVAATRLQILWGDLA